MELDKRAIGKRMKVFAVSKFNSITEFAEALGVSSTTLSGTYFNGRSMPGGELLARLSELGCDLQELLFGTKVKEDADKSITNIQSGSTQNIYGELDEMTNAIQQAGRTKISNNGTPDSIVVELLKSQKEQIKYLQQNLSDKSERLAFLEVDLKEKTTKIVEYEANLKTMHNEIMSRINEIYNYIVEHDNKSTASHIATHKILHTKKNEKKKIKSQKD